MRSRRLVFATAMLSACAPSQPHVLRPLVNARRVPGIVVNSDGQPVARAIVIASDPDTADELGFAYSDDRGRFFLETPAAKYSVAATTAKAWALVPNAHSRAGDLRIELSTS